MKNKTPKKRIINIAQNQSFAHREVGKTYKIAKSLHSYIFKAFRGSINIIFIIIISFCITVISILLWLIKINFKTFYFFVYITCYLIYFLFVILICIYKFYFIILIIIFNMIFSKISRLPISLYLLYFIDNKLYV